MGRHALLSASSSKRWLNCPPSARLEEQFTGDIGSVYAEEGTAAHALAEHKLKRLLSGALNVRYRIMTVTKWKSVRMSLNWKTDSAEKMKKTAERCRIALTLHPFRVINVVPKNKAQKNGGKAI